MKYIKELLLAVPVVLLTFAASGKKEIPVSKTIKGVWTIEKMDVGIGENKRTTVPQSFMMFIMDKHYSAIRDFSSQPRPAMTFPSESAEDFRASIVNFMADAGTYEYDGTELVLYHQVAMIPNMAGGGSTMTFGCHLEGDDTLILTPQYDKMVIPGMNLAPSKDGKMTYGDVATRYQFRRLE